MPSIAGIDLADGIKILMGTGGTNPQYTSAQLASYLAAHTIAQTETTVNNFLAGYLPSDQVKVHIFSVSPLKYTVYVSNRQKDDGTPNVIPANWWAH
jgi:hypothetical protein